jgi:hypothetical protein
VARGQQIKKPPASKHAGGLSEIKNGTNIYARSDFTNVPSALKVASHGTPFFVKCALHVPSLLSFHCLTGTLPNFATNEVSTACGGVPTLSSPPERDAEVTADELSSVATFSLAQEARITAIVVIINSFFIIDIFVVINKLEC